MFFILCDIIYFWWDCRGNLKLNGLNGWKCIRNFANVMFLWGFCHLEWVCLKRKSEVVDTPLPSRTNPHSPWWSIQISPAASPEILHHTVWRTWLFTKLTQMKDITLPILTTAPHLYTFCSNVGRMYFLNLGVKGLTLSVLRSKSTFPLTYSWENDKWGRENW